jgi:hypothetical protein
MLTSLYYYDSVTRVVYKRFVKVQVTEAQLSDSDSSTNNKPDKSPPHEQKSTQKGELEATN